MRTRESLTVAVGGGKGGVGKSLVSANLSIAFGQLGLRVIVVDADLGSANLHTLFGIERPGPTLQALFDKEIHSLEQAVIPTDAPRVHLVPGSGAHLGAANPGHQRKLKLIRHIRALEADVVVIDCGAGTAFDVLDFFDMADCRLLVVTPQLTSVHNAYAFLKSALYRSIRQTAVTREERALFERLAHGPETERVHRLLEALAAEAPDYAEATRKTIEHFGASMIGNQLEATRQVAVFERLAKLFDDFLDLRVPLLGWLPLSGRMHRSVGRRRPLLLEAPQGPEARMFQSVAERIAETDVQAVREARRRLAPATSRRGDSAPPGPIANVLRGAPRYEVCWRGRVRLGEHEAEGRYLNVSAGGAAVEVPLPAREGDRVTLSVTDPGGLPPLLAEVRRVERRERRWLLGLSFVPRARQEAARWEARAAAGDDAPSMTSATAMASG